MKTILFTLQVVSAFSLVIAVLLHSAKGEGMGSIGGNARIFGPQKGLEEGLDRITTICAVAFIIFSIALAVVSS